MRLVALCLLLFASADVSAQWGGGSCGPVRSAPVYHGWYAVDGKAELWWRGEKIGTLDTEYCYWTTNGADHILSMKHIAAGAVVSTDDVGSRKLCCCGDKCEPCKCYPCSAKDCKENCGCGKNDCGKKRSIEGLEGIPVRNFGVDRRRCCDEDSECCRVNGREVSKEKIFEAIRRAVPDDSKQQRVVVVGSDEKRRAVLADWGKGELASFKDKAILQCYPPTHWHVQAVGYRAAGDVSIYVTDSTGRVLHRQDYYDGPGKLAAALRKADPAYDPAKDPDLNKPKPPDTNSPANGGPASGFPQWQPWIVALLLGIAGYLFAQFRARKG